MASENGVPIDNVERTLKPKRVINNSGGCTLMEMGVSHVSQQLPQPIPSEFLNNTEPVNFATEIKGEWIEPSEDKAGLKYDQGKPRLGLVFNGFSKALTEVGKVGTFGAEKYTPNGWVSVPNAQERYTDAMYRHLMSEQSGELWDKESNLFHAAHAAWNALARLELLLRETDKQLEEGY